MNTAPVAAPMSAPNDPISTWCVHKWMATLAAKTAGHICRPQRMHAAAAMPPASGGTVVCTPTLGSMNPPAPAVKTAANVTNHLNAGTGRGFIRPKRTTNRPRLSSI
jgi:hypothetical protein